MDATALTTSPLAIQIHATSAILALILGSIVLLMGKGTPVHKAMGRVWIGLMITVALSSFFITEIRMFGPYSLIHAFSIYTLFGVIQAVMAIRRGNVKAHRGHMIGLYTGALILAGAFTLLPGRRMHAVVFADGGISFALVLSAVVLVVGTILVRRRLRMA